MKLVSFFIITFALTCMLLGSLIYQMDLENGELRDINNFTESSLTYKGNYTYNELSNNYTIYNLPEIKYNRMGRAVDSFVNFVLVTSFEATKFFIEYGYENPQHNYRLYAKILIVMLFLSFWSALIPLIVILVLIYKGIKKLIIHLKKKEKKNENHK